MDEKRDGTYPDSLPRCAWACGPDALMRYYHDAEWGTPIRDERRLFEALILDGFQAGLSWRTILYKREAFRAAFDHFDAEKIAAYTAEDVERLMQNPGIVRNRAKIRAAIKNARVFLDIQKEFGSFADYLTGFVRQYPGPDNPEATTAPAGDAASRDLVLRGMRFAGPIVVFEVLRAVGLLPSHAPGCFRYETNKGESV